jgi:hypothetical protein
VGKRQKSSKVLHIVILHIKYNRALTSSEILSGLLASVDEASDGKRRVMLSSGKETDIESAEKAGRLRYDDLACGKFAVGRHAQVLFDGGMWYVGVVAKLQVDMHAEPTAAVMLFEGNYFFPAALCTWTCMPRTAGVLFEGNRGRLRLSPPYTLYIIIV